MDMPCTEERSVRDVIGLVLIDLDRLASGVTLRSEGVPYYAAAFVGRRLAARWTARYQVDLVAAEAEQRFVKARATAPDRLTPEYEQALARVAAHCRELASTIQKLAQDV
jgi:hypothetical protein